ncbi:MAG: dephospho-CoA kinase [Fidelibacterota bacterium]
MIKIGITGGLGSGKTTASQFFAKRGAFVFDADNEVKSHLLHSHSVQRKLFNVFGKSIKNVHNKLDFAELAKVAFSNPMDQKILNGIIWPEAYLLVEKEIERCTRENVKIFVLDAAMLIEAQFSHVFDHVLLIVSDIETRIKRARRRGNLSDEQIKKRMALQMSDEDKKPFATHVIENNGSKEMFNKLLDNFYSNLNL